MAPAPASLLEDLSGALLRHLIALSLYSVTFGGITAQRKEWLRSKLLFDAS